MQCMHFACLRYGVFCMICFLEGKMMIRQRVVLDEFIRSIRSQSMIFCYFAKLKLFMEKDVPVLFESQTVKHQPNWQPLIDFSVAHAI